jgi:cysteinyl-tRNA synthetase
MLAKFYGALAKVEDIDILPQVEPDPEVMDALRNDLNIPKALVRMHALLRQLINAKTDIQRVKAKTMLLKSAELMGLMQRSPKDFLSSIKPDPALFHQESANKQVKALLAEREKARNKRDFARADALRNELQNAGFTIKDTANGPELRAMKEDIS